ncbi:hypothetical protein CRE_03346 [Caenorhabditis remanei]|uniref:Transmembrane protein 144 n=1 Tax=Caenorhabditis remanei TaxID=31234 RepID=E3MYL9_CAERE|nr:hypothetical protein CRE_03346 [Caenorhabditis remanei]
MEKDTTLGIVCAVVSAITFGSTYVPLKWFHKGDGLYFQWVQSLGQLLVGVTVALTTTPAPIHPIAMLSGMFYSIGNSLTVFIMDGIGLAIGYLLWNTVTCVVGWAVTRFGLFANPQQHPRSDWLNILGVVTVCVGGAIYAPIKHIPSRVRPAPWSVEEDYKTDPLVVQEVSCTRRIICLFLTIFVGFLYGNFLTPINYIIANEPGSHQDVRAYILSYCLGSFVTSTVIFFFYAIFKKNTPLVNAELSMPSIVSGILYGIAVTTFFMANQHLDQVIAYPILSKAPGIIVSLWAIFLFKEIQGKKDIIQLYIGIGVTLLGIAFISLSKVEF